MTTWLEALRIDVSSNGAGADDLTSATHYKVREALTDGAPLATASTASSARPSLLATAPVATTTF